MDKNVGSVNLEELKLAREALDKERGIETDPNMYNDYDPEKHKLEKEQEKLSRQNEESEVIEDASEVSAEEINDIIEEDESKDSSETTTESVSADVEQKENDLSSFFDNDSTSSDNHSESENEQKEKESEKSSDEISKSADEEINLNLYDSFSDFEIESVSQNEETSKDTNEEKSEAEEELKIEDDNSEIEIESNKETSADLLDSESNIDDFLNDLDLVLAKDDSSTQKDKDEINDSEIVLESVVKTDDEPQDSDLNKSDDGELKSREDNFFEKNDKQNSISKSEKNDFDFDTEILTDFSKLSELASIESEDEESDEEKEKVDSSDNDEEVKDEPEEDIGGYNKIEIFNFVDVMSSEEFKNADNLSYVLGKDSTEKMHYGNLSDTCGTLVYTRKEENVYNIFNSIILSLIVKNPPQKMQFVICDPMFDSEFDAYKKSSYMYFNRVAKNNREIVDSLIELSKELENRYNNLVYSGVKNISAYNLQAEERNVDQMPYIVLFINNYVKMMQFLDSDRINTCLHNILKFGRLVGIYVMLASTSDIDRNDINFNLPTRISFKTDDEHQSISAIGRPGAEMLKDSQDFLYSTIYDEELKHLKVPAITRKEIDLIIENLEN